MKKIILAICMITVFLMTFLSGCQQEGTTTDKNFDNIILDSDVVKLVYSDINFNKDDNGIILNVEVQYRFKNIVDRNIDINVFAEFYDKDNNLLAKVGPKEISIPKGWTEQGISPANIISYSGKNAALVEHVNILVEEKV